MIKKGTLHKSEGHYFINKKRQGLFVTHKKGVFKDGEKEVPYHKARITQIFQQKKGEGISITMQRPYRFISFDPDMLKNVAKLLDEIHKEIFGEPLFGGEIKEVKTEEPKTESDEVDELLAQLNSLKGRK